jgi:hypothetical protein
MCNPVPSLRMLFDERATPVTSRRRPEAQRSTSPTRERCPDVRRSSPPSLQRFPSKRPANPSGELPFPGRGRDSCANAVRVPVDDGRSPSNEASSPIARRTVPANVHHVPVHRRATRFGWAASLLDGRDLLGTGGNTPLNRRAPLVRGRRTLVSRGRQSPAGVRSRAREVRTRSGRGSSPLREPHRPWSERSCPVAEDRHPSRGVASRTIRGDSPSDEGASRAEREPPPPSVRRAPVDRRVP